MKRVVTLTWPRLFLSILLLFGGTSAQQQQSATDLAVKVDTGEPSDWEIPAFDGAGAATRRFKRLKSVEAITETSVVDLFFKINREGDLVVTHLSVRLANEKEIAVGTYKLRENESTTTEELAKVGIEPLTLRIVRAKPRFVDPSPPIQPLLENKTKAVEFVSFSLHPSAPNSFRLVLRNISTKGIMAVDLFMPSPDGNGGGGLRQMGNRDYLVMAPGATSEFPVSVTRGGRNTPAGYIPDLPVQQTLIVRAVVFEDGTYDGLLETAAEMMAQRRGANLQRKKILVLFKRLIQGDERQPLTTFDQFKEEVYELNDTTDVSTIRELADIFPTVNEKSLIENVKIGMIDEKRMLLNHLNEFENQLKEKRGNLTWPQWLEHVQAEYERRIEPF